jgi:hypothetical protein
MRLKSLSYKENLTKADANPWQIEELILDERNLIVAKNATGKTRILGTIHNLARLIQAPQQILVNGVIQKIIINGEWSTSFISESGEKFDYFVSLDRGEVVCEKISVNGKEKLKRELSSAKIYSETALDWQEISPPNDRLVVHVRRDKNEFSFLEQLMSWAEGVRGFSFANTSPHFIEIPGNPYQFTSLGAVPSILEQLTDAQLQKVLNQLRSMNYIVETVSVDLVEGLPPKTKIVFIKEEGIAIPLKQFEISQGMFRAFSLLTIIEFLRSSNKISAIFIDDLCEGLDFERSKKLAEIIFAENLQSNIQFITTSNDIFLTNTVPLNNLTICYRKNHTVSCLNYSNSKNKFDEWRQFGLNNFDLLSSNFLLD